MAPWPTHLGITLPYLHYFSIVPEIVYHVALLITVSCMGVLNPMDSMLISNTNSGLFLG